MGILERIKGRKRSQRVDLGPTRPVALEMLEPRLMLSAEPIPTAVADALAAGIVQFENRLDSFIDNETLLDTYLPLIVRNEGSDLLDMKSVAPTLRELLSVSADINGDGHVGDNPDPEIDVPTAIRDAELALGAYDTNADKTVDIVELLTKSFFDPIVDPATGYLKTGTPTDTGFVSFLQALDVPETGLNPGEYNPSEFYNPARYFTLTVSSVSNTGLSDPNQVSFQLNFNVNFGNELAIDLGTYAEKELGITLPSAALVMDTSLSFTVEFGVFTSGENPVNSDFFIELDNFKVKAYDTLSMAGAELNVGFLGCEMTGGTVTLNAEVIADLTDPTSPDVLGFNGTHYSSSAGTIAGEIGLSDGDAELAHDVSFFLRIGSSNAKEVKISAASTSGYTLLTQLIARIQSASDGVNFTDLVKVSDDGSGHITLSLTDDPTDLNVLPLGFTSNNPPVAEDGILTAVVAPSILGSSSQTTIKFLLSVGHAVPKLVTVTTTPLDDGGNLTLDGLLIDINNGLAGAGLGALVEAQESAGKVQLVSKDNPKKSLEITKTLTLESKVSYSDLTSSSISISDLLPPEYTTGPTGSRAEVTLNVEAVTSSLWSFGPTFDITINSVNPFTLTPPVPDPQTDDIRFAFDGVGFENLSGATEQDIQNFTNITASNVVGLLHQLAGWLDGVRTSELIASYNIPFADADLGDLLNFADMIYDELIINDQDNTDPGDDVSRLVELDNTPKFLTAQGLAAGLDTLLSGPVTVNYDPDPDANAGTNDAELTYSITVSHSLAHLEVPIDFSLDLAPLLSLSSDTIIRLDADAKLVATFGLMLGSVGGETLTGGTTLNELGVEVKTDPAVTGEEDVDAFYGRLSDDAHLTITIGGIEYDVTVPASATAANETADDLKARIIEAFNTAKDPGDADFNLNTLIEVISDGNRIKLISKSTSSFELRALSSDPTVTDIGFGIEQNTTDLSLTAGSNAKSDGKLTDDAVFSLTITLYGGTDDERTDITEVIVSKGSTLCNSTVDDLIIDVNSALASARLDSQIRAVKAGAKIKLMAVDGAVTAFSLTADSGNPANTELGFGTSQSASSEANPFLFALIDLRPTIGRLNGDVSFLIEVDDEVPVSVTLAYDDTAANRNIIDLINDFNHQLAPFVATSTISSFVLTADVAFSISLDGGSAESVTVYADNTNGTNDANGNAPGHPDFDPDTAVANETLEDLVRDLNFAVSQNPNLKNKVRAEAKTDDSTIRLKVVDSSVNKFQLAADAGNQLGLPESQIVTRIEATASGNRVVLTATDDVHFTITADATAQYELGFGASQESNSKDLIIHLSGTTDETATYTYQPTYEIELDDADTIQKVIDAIQDQTDPDGAGPAPSAVVVEFNDVLSPTALNLTDRTWKYGTKVFFIEPTNGSNAGIQLGIVRADATSDVNDDCNIDYDDSDGIIEGAPIIGPKLTDRFFVEDVELSAEFELTTPGGIDALATFGFVGVRLLGSGSLGGKISTELIGSGSANRLTLTELIDGLNDIRSIVEVPTISDPTPGDPLGKLELTLSLEPEILDFGTDLISNPNIDITINNLGDPFHKTTFGSPVFVDSDTFELPGDETEALEKGAKVTAELTSDTVTTKITDIAYDDDDLVTVIDVLDGVLDDTLSEVTIATPTPPDIDITTPTLDDLSGLGNLLNFQELNFDTIFDGIQALFEFLRQFEAFGFLDEPLPLINKSINDLLSFAEGFDRSVFGDLTFESANEFKLPGDLTGLLKEGVDITIQLTSGAVDSKIIGFEFDGENTIVTIQDDVLDDTLSTATILTQLLFAAALDEAEESAAAQIQVLESKLKDVLGLPSLGPAELGFTHNMYSPAGTGEVLADSAPTDPASLSENIVFLLAVGDAVPKEVTVETASAGNLSALVNNIRTALEDAFGTGVVDVTTAGGKIKIYSTASTPESLEIRDFVDLSLVTSSAILQVDLTLLKSFSESLNVEIPDFLNLEAAGFGTVGLAGSAGLNASGGLAALLDFGIGLTGDDLGNFYLFDTSAIRANLEASGSDLTFRAALGPLGLYIKEGEATIGGDFSLELDDAAPIFTNHRASIGDIFSSADNIDVNIGGAIDVTLPTYFPTESKYIGDITIAGDLEDIANVVFITDPSQLPAPADSIVFDLSGVVPDILDFDLSKLSLFDNILLAVDGVDLFLEGLQNLLDGEVFGFSIPLVGDALSDGARFIEDFRMDFIQPFREAIEAVQDAARDFADADKNIVSKFLFDILGPDGLELLKPLPGADLAVKTPGDYIGLDTNLDEYLEGENIDMSALYIEWDVNLGQEYTVGTDIGIDLGIPGLGIKTEGDITVTLTWDLDFGFGISFADGFYVDVSDDNELVASVDVDLNGASLTGTLSFLQLSAVVQEGTNFALAFEVDIKNRKDATDGKLSFTEITSIGIGAGIAAEASVYLGLALEISDDLIGSNVAAGFPKVIADFAFEWGIGTYVEDNPLTPENEIETSDFVSLTEIGNAIQEGLKYVAFEDIGLDMGSFVSDVLGPIVGKVKEITEPLQPIIDVLTTPIPVISDLGMKITLIDIAAAYGSIDPGLIYAIADIITFINSIPDPDDIGFLILPFGDMVIYDNRDPEGFTFTPALWDSKLDSSDTFQDIMNNGQQLLDKFTEILGGDGWFADTLGTLAGNAAADIMGDALDESGGTESPWSFPIFEDPSQVFGLFMGKPAVLVTYDMPPLEFEFEWSQFFSIWGPLGVSINIEFGVVIDFAFGYDTLGIQQFVEGGFRNPLLLINGFYVSDTDLPTGDFGTDVPELVVTGGLWAAAEINLVIARAGVGGGIFAQIEFDLYDPDHDGKVRIMELVGNVVNEWNYGIKPLAPLAIFDVHGEITAKLFAFLKIDLFLFEIEKRWNITPEFTLVEFDIPFTRPPNLATELGNGDLQINAGEFAGERLNGNTSDIGEHFIIEQAGTGKVRVKAPGIWDHWQTYELGSNGGTIYVNLGEGDDWLEAHSFTDSNIKFEIDGGPGSDKIELGPSSAPGASIIYGTDGDDLIYGGSGNDVIYGGKGNDEIHAGGGNDLVFGDDGVISDATVRVTVNSTDGNDTIYGDAGDDILFGAGGTDTIHGGGNNDIIIGDGGQIGFWTMMGTATGGTSNTLVDADLLPGETFPTGGTGLQGFVVEITGGTGAGQEREIGSNTATQLTVTEDWTKAETIPDGTSTYQIIAPKTVENIDWTEGVTDTELMGLGSSDILNGDSGNDRIYGGVGDDEIDGGGGGDKLFGESGRDEIHGGDGDDTIFGDGWKLTIIEDVQVLQPTSGGEGDFIYGDAHNDKIYGGGGNDRIEGGDNDDKIYGGSGSDTLYGDSETHGPNDGDDTIYGQGDPDVIYGGGANDTLDGGDGADVVFGDNGPADYKDRVYSLAEALEDAGLEDWIQAELDGSSIKLTAIESSITGFQILASPDDPDGYLEFGFADGQSATGSPLSLTGSAVSGPLLAKAVLLIRITTADGTTTRAVKAVQISEFYGIDTGIDTIHAGFGWDYLDGQGGTDTYILRPRGGDNESLIEVYDSGEAGAGTDVMKVYGTYEPDQFLLRASADPTGLAFVALINSTTRRDTEGEFVIDLTVERIDYDNLERLVVNGLLGDDRFAVDDVRAETTLNGGLGRDFFQVGQLYRSQRTPELANVDPGDVFATIETTRGWLSNGISQPMVVNGGPENDNFVVFHNLAVLTLNGGDGDDTFMIKAFALVGSEEPKRGRTDVSGGHGADLVQYAVNAPVNIDGGDGFDTVIIIGTEFGDDFVVTKNGVYGAGLNVNFVNIESLEIDGAEGNDRFFVRSTSEKFITHISGGLGNDTFFMSGDTPPIISNDLLGHSGIITHSVEDVGTETDYDGIKVEGISANVADDDEPGVRITQSDGITFVTEGVGEDSYTIVLTSQPREDVLITVMAPSRTPTEEELKSRSFRVYSYHILAQNEVDGSATTLRFTPYNWNIPQTVYVNALIEGEDEYDDFAYEGLRYGVINHIVSSEDTSYPGALSAYEQTTFDDGSKGTIITDILANFPTAVEGLRGAYIEIIEGPGVGQRFLIKENTTESLTFFGTFSVNNLPATDGSTRYVIRRYDGMALPSVQVEIHDNDSAGVAVIEVDNAENPDGSTEVIEVETPTDGETDKLRVALTRQPVDGTPVYVTISSKVPEQVKFDGSPDGVLNPDGSLTLTFTYGDWDAQTVKVTAIDDDVREGFHYGLIEFTVSGEGDGEGTIVDETFFLMDKPEEYEGPPLHPDADYVGLPEAFVGLSHKPKPETVVVTIDGVNIDDIPGLDYTVVSNKVVFLEEGDVLPKVVDGLIVVNYDYTIPGYEGLFVAPVLVRIADDDAPGVIITETYGSTDVIEIGGAVSSATHNTLSDLNAGYAPNSLMGYSVKITGGSGEGQSRTIVSNAPTVLTVSEDWDSEDMPDETSTYEIIPDGAPWVDTYSVRLTSDPGGAVWVNVKAEVTKTTRGKIRNDLVQVRVDTDAPGHEYGVDELGDPILKLRFDSGNWSDPQYVTVTAVDDSVVDGGDTKVFAAKLHTVNDIQGPVFVNGAGGSGSLLAFEPVMLPQGADPDLPETNVKPNTKSLVNADGTTVEVVTLDALTSGDVGAIAELIGKTIEITEGPAIDKFRLIKNVLPSTNPDNIILVINAAFTILEDGEEVPVDIPDGTQYLITEESWTFFVDEETQVDFLFVFHEDSVADNVGGIKDSTTVGFDDSGLVEKFTVELDGKRIYGLGMGQDLYIGGALQPGGITYGNIEVVEINLGSGNDEFTVDDTHARMDGFQTWTMVNTGDNTDDGSDVVYVSLTREVGDDITGTATASTETTLTDDSSPFGADDSLVGYIVEITAGTGVGARREIISNTSNTIEVSSLWPTEDNLLGPDSEYLITIAEVDGSFALNTEGGDDIVHAELSTIPLVIFGGEGDDKIYSGTGDDIIFGDRGQVDYFDENEMIVTRLGVDREAITGEVNSADNTGEETATLEGIDINISGTLVDFPIPEYPIDEGLRGLEVQITHYTGYGQELLILTNTADTLTLSGNWDPVPVGIPASKFRIPILPEDQTDGVIRDPSLLLSTHADIGGDDTIMGNAGSDRIFGGYGDDEIYGNEDEDIIFGDNGRLDYTPPDPATREAPSFGDEVPASLDKVQTIHPDIGGSDTIYGNEADDIILGGYNPAIPGQEDTIEGNTGNDVILGDNGLLDFSPDPGPESGPRDVVLDLVQATDHGIGGPDIISGNAGDDTVIGEAGGDTIYGDDEAASAAGDDGEDILLGDNGEILLTGGVDGRLYILGNAVNKIQTTDDENSTGGADTISGNAAADVILGGVNGTEQGEDTIYGDAEAPGTNDADDLILGDNGVLDFDYDWVSEIPGDGDLTTLDLVRSEPYAFNDDVLGGDDTISGNAGNDTVIGGTGGDTIYGNDAAAYADNVDGKDILIGDNGDILLSGNVAASLFVLDSAVNKIQTTDYEEATGGADTISGNADEDIILGGVNGTQQGQDTIYGDAAAPGTNDADDLILGDNGWFEYGLPDDDVADLGRPDVVDYIGGTTLTLDSLLPPDLSTLDRVTTVDPTLGGDDVIYGNAGNDIIFGGTGRDRIWGDSDNDNHVDNAVDGDGADLLLGDHGKIYPTLPALDPLFINNNFFAIDTAETDGADTDGNAANGNDFGDTIFGSGNDDTILGQQGDDILFGGADDDIIIGGHNVVGGIDEQDEMDEALIAAILSGVLADKDASDINDVNDVMDGGSDEDLLAGDNAIVIRQNEFTEWPDSTSPRYQLLTDTVIYNMVTQDLDGLFLVDVGFAPNISGVPQLKPASDVGRTIILLDHSEAIQVAAAQNPNDPRVFGNDVMAGGSEDDEMFGQLGDDIMQGDGSVDLVTDTTGLQMPDDETPFNPSPAVDPSFVIPDDQSASTYFMVDDNYLVFRVDERTGDADDYMEGNGGNDRMYGNLGQDDMIGDNSTLFGLDDATAVFYDPEIDFARPYGADLIYGGAGNPDRLERNAEVDPEFGDGAIAPDENHGRDADMILGDNGNIYRLVEADEISGETEFLTFNYDQLTAAETSLPADGYSTNRPIIPRAVELLDYAYMYTDLSDPNSLSFSGIGAGDLIYGETGDDTIHGMTGDDVLFGNSEDDDLYGEVGNDWISGGTGEDGILGDDGLILTSRNDINPEPLYGIEGLDDTGSDANISLEISTPGNIQRAIINVADALKKAVDLIAFAGGGNEIIFGGLGSDSLHGGFGDDAISGAEALPAYYDGGTFGFASVNQLLKDQQNAPTAPDPVLAPDPFWIEFAPYNPGDILRYEGNAATDPADDPHGKTKQEFALYDEFHPRRKIMLDANGEAVEEAADAVFDFLLNFDETEGPQDWRFSDSETDPEAAKPSDGDDKIFGDLGNDWIVGGSGRDHMYGGRGDDLLNMDDDHDSGGRKVKHNDPEPDPLDNNISDEYQAYADIAYGGAGRDVLILNTGADRAMDWVGEYNSYITPFAPFGAFHISRNLQPQLPEFLYALSESDGADQTVPDGARFVEQKTDDIRIDEPDPLRNGEPYGELGMVRQMDYDWHNQTGAPNDPQPGNLQGPREIMRRELFTDGNTPLAFAVDTGIWAVRSGVYNVAPEVLGSEAVSLYFLDEVQPLYMEILATINANKDKAGFKSNAYIIFDYLSPTDFKFAGIDVGLDKLRIGHRTAEGWVVDVQSNMRLRANSDYDLTLVLHGVVATLYVNETKNVSFTFDDALNDGGMIGLATNNAFASFDDFQVQVLPPVFTFEIDAVAMLTRQTGLWRNATMSSRCQGRPAPGDEAALTTLSLDVALASLLELEATIYTQARGGVLFDYYGPNDFKFVAILADTDQVVIGHRTTKGWFYDAVVDRTIDVAVSYQLGISLKGTSVSVSLDGQVVLGYVFNGLVTDGDVGLLSIGGASSFYDVVMRGDDPDYQSGGTNLMASAAAQEPVGDEAALTYYELAPIVEEAIDRWSDSLIVNDGTLALLDDVTFQITDLSGLNLGQVAGTTVLLDATAAGYGWFVDLTPSDDIEFSELANGELVATASGPAFGTMDLLTVVMHELGHVLGSEDIDPEEQPNDLMSATLAAGVRRIDADAATATLSLDGQIVLGYPFSSLLSDGDLALFSAKGVGSRMKLR